MRLPLRERATRQRRWAWIGGVAASASALLLGAGELFARWHLGLGTPPLMTADAELEYRYLPNQDVMRFGNRILIDSFGMRSAGPAAGTEAAADAFRVLVLGDSVINGGSLTDHEELATTLLQKSLERRLGRSVWVGNASAGSWGPENLLAFVKRYGTFDAEVAVVEIAAHDIVDVRRFPPLGENRPTQTPFSALWEGATRYLPRYLPLPSATTQPAKPREASKERWDPADRHKSETATFELLRLLKKSVPNVFMLYQPELHESGNHLNLEAKSAFERIAAESGCTFVDLTSIDSAVPESALYRDRIHPSAKGQSRIENAIEAFITINDATGAAPKNRVESR